MKKVLITKVTDGITRREGLLSMLGGAMALAGCGGGGGGGLASVTSGGTGSFSSGPITGFGSIILNSNGVRIDDSTATITDDDGNNLRGQLKLGMLATVQGSAVTGSTATATSIVISGELQGRIQGTPNTTNRTFVVLGQTVQVTGSTIFDVSLANGFSSLASDTIVEVHGVLDPAANSLAATFIERKASPQLFKIQGVVSNHDATARKFNIGATRIDYSAATDVRITPVNGALVRVRLTAVLPPLAAPAEWLATRIRPSENVNQDRDEAEIEGSITAFTSAAQFSVNGVAVTTSSSTRFDDGTAGLAVGARVEVRGRISGGVLIADRVKIEDANDVNNLEFELHGAVSAVTATTFEVRGIRVNYTSATPLRNGSLANLVNGALVEVRGTALNPVNASTSINATRISFK